MAVAAMALVVLLRGVGSSQVAAYYLEAHLGARVIAQTILEDERQAADTAPATREGDSGMYHWRFVIEPAEVAAVGKLPAGYSLYHLSVQVQWTPHGSFALDTLKLAR